MRRLLVLLGLLLVGLLPAAAGAAPAGGWHLLRSPAGFVVSAPGTWVDFTRATPDLIARAKAEPKLQAYLEMAKRTKAIKLLAVDVTPARLATGFATNVNVVQVPTVGDARLQADATATQLRSLGILVGKVQTQSTSLPAGPSFELRYHARFTSGGPVVSTTQYFLVHAGKGVVLTYTTVPTFEKFYRTIFERSARSFRFLR